MAALEGRDQGIAGADWSSAAAIDLFKDMAGRAGVIRKAKNRSTQ
ncbi:MAG TPA: hypothetical protein VIK18_20895 [Pirellulales bacterium]